MVGGCHCGSAEDILLTLFKIPIERYSCLTVLIFLSKNEALYIFEQDLTMRKESCFTCQVYTIPFNST
ncbi:hypothetical protein Xkoz_01495 [Xenorhabdus kozodoii]|uniref:Uncharacterized protein n=1 Tax=Xenorhabdus kozodoii TaxID=351676 RepID=A0A2D0LDA4_9GAMM|nr:hypothetical protein Xkoz_01495 [Xenorhabdus kozodoii]